jgi:hypothetical protein
MTINPDPEWKNRKKPDPETAHKNKNNFLSLIGHSMSRYNNNSRQYFPLTKKILYFFKNFPSCILLKYIYENKSGQTENRRKMQNFFF